MLGYAIHKVISLVEKENIKNISLNDIANIASKNNISLTNWQIKTITKYFKDLLEK